jgi:BclB C-terminal domain-containing protein
VSLGSIAVASDYVDGAEYLPKQLVVGADGNPYMIGISGASGMPGTSGATGYVSLGSPDYSVIAGPTGATGTFDTGTTLFTVNGTTGSTGIKIGSDLVLASANGTVNAAITQDTVNLSSIPVAVTYNEADSSGYQMGEFILAPNGKTYVVSSTPVTGAPGGTGPSYSVIDFTHLVSKYVAGTEANYIFAGDTTEKLWAIKTGDTTAVSGTYDASSNTTDYVIPLTNTEIVSGLVIEFYTSPNAVTMAPDLVYFMDRIPPNPGAATGPTGPAGPSAIYLNSGTTQVSLAVAAAGAAGTASYIGSGSAGSGINVLGASFTLSATDSAYTTTLARDATVDSLAANYTAEIGGAISASPITVNAQLYYAAPGSNSFDPIASSVIAMQPQASSINLGTLMYGAANGINYPVAQGGRLILAYNTVGGMLTAIGVLTGSGSAAIGLI